MLLKVNNSYIYTDFDIYYINSYINYIIDTLKTIVLNNNLNINIVIGNFNYTFNNNNKIIKININWEHTLVKKNGRDIGLNSIEGKVFANNNEKYLVRIERFSELEKADIIIDYSIPNMYNIFFSVFNNLFYDKMIYISPVLFKYELKNYIKNERKINVLTTFINLNEPRRNKLLSDLKTQGIQHINVNNCFDTQKIYELYKNTKILINIHQTDHHHTFEELRVLPALLSGVLVISELSPLNNLIPYNDLILWTSYDNITNFINIVINNYDSYYDKIFSQKNKLSRLHNNNIKKLESKLLSL